MGMGLLAMAASAAIGMAEADFYPRITLSGSLGFQATQLSDLGSWGSRNFAFGPGLSVPVFEGGRLQGALQLQEGRDQQARQLPVGDQLRQ